MRKLFLISIVFIYTFQLYPQQGANPFAKYGYEVLTATSSNGEFIEFHDLTDIVQVGDVLYNTQTKEIVGFTEKEIKDESISSAITAMSIDPHCERYYSISPYAYCMNNPIRFVDPDGRDVYRFDDESGTFHLMEENDDKTDKVMGFHQDKKTGEWKKNTGFFQTKTRMDGIEKGILSDGINFKQDNNAIKIGGEDGASLAGVENFIVGLSEMVGVEISGYYLADTGTENISHVHMGKYERNTYNSAYKSYNAHRDYPNLVNSTYEHTDYHTHPSRAADSDRTSPSRTDINAKRNTQKSHPQVKKFIILTKGYSPIQY